MTVDRAKEDEATNPLKIEELERLLTEVIVQLKVAYDFVGKESILDARYNVIQALAKLRPSYFGFVIEQFPQEGDSPQFLECAFDNQTITIKIERVNQPEPGKKKKRFKFF